MSNIRKRVVSASKALYVGPSPATGSNLTGVKQLHRLQSLDYDFSIPKEDVVQFGQLAAIDRVNLEGATVNLSASYLITDVVNERALGFSTNGGISVLSGILSKAQDEKNYFVMLVDEGSDAAGFTANSGATIGIGNGFISNYSVEASVGGFATASFSIEGLNMEGYARPSGTYLPAVNPVNGQIITGQSFALPQATSGAAGQPSALQPGDITVTLGDSAKFMDLSDISVQSFNCSFDLAREQINALGYKYARTKEITFPINVNLSVEVLAADLKTGSISSLLCSSAGNDISVSMRQPNCDGTGNVALALTIKNAKLESQSWSTQLGSNQTVSLNWIAQVGGAGDTVNGLHMSGVTGY